MSWLNISLTLWLSVRDVSILFSWRVCFKSKLRIWLPFLKGLLLVCLRFDDKVLTPCAWTMHGDLAEVNLWHELRFLALPLFDQWLKTILFNHGLVWLG